ncbi:uncharacterized protein SAMN05444162_1252 [Paenibacillaceae bacterium GAS479]|nr:uncharacterized protein SAMN05444162_1252 [Paenibacillaceae bacterium GAS479]
MEQQTKRIHLVDSMRGFSLLGILLANMLIFQYGMYGTDKLNLFPAVPGNSTFYEVTAILIEGSFMPIFAFLFGYSLLKLKESLVAQGRKPGWALSRRFLLLIGLGLLHSVYIWEGDILLYYGGTGFLLLLFLNRKPKTLLVWTIVLMSLMGLLGFIPDSPSDPSFVEIDKETLHYVKETVTLYPEATYNEIMHHRSTESPMNNDPAFLITMLLLVPLISLPMFLLGIYGAKKSWFQNPDIESPMYAKGALILITLGIGLKLLKFVFPGMVLSGGPVLSIGYIMAFALVYSKLMSPTWRSRFAAVGKLSLTNYLMQSVICTTIFYGYGLGWFGKIGVGAGILLAVLIYSAQLFASSWYVSHFRIGPVERLLRMGTYFTLSGKAKRS